MEHPARRHIPPDPTIPNGTYNTYANGFNLNLESGVL